MSVKSFLASDLSIPELHSYLLGAIVPRPIGFVSTIDAQGNVNLSPYSFFNCFGSNPPVLIYSPAKRVRDNTLKHSLENVREVPEVCINMVDSSIVEQMSLSSTEYNKGVNEFVKSGLTPVESDTIRPPRVGESPASFECSVEQIIETGTEGGAGNLVICHVKKLHIREDILDESGKIDPYRYRAVARLGGNYYSEVIPDSIFEVEKPLREKGIGVDQLPENILNSTVLTGNDLGKLANIAQIPTKGARDEWMEKSQIEQVVKHMDGPERTLWLHTYAAKCLKNGELSKAWYVLLLE